MATDFKTYKKVNNWCNCEHVSVTVFSCKWCERRKGKFRSSWLKPCVIWHCFI